jgi:hypothetical protein
MKKLVLFTALLIFHFADASSQSNEAYIEQVGSGHESFIQQSPGETNSVNENGTFPGNNNAVPPGVPFQGNNTGEFTEGNSFAEIIQHELDNRADIIQEGSHWAQIFQNGFNNLASISQKGGNNSGFTFNPPGVSEPCPPPFALCTGTGEGSTAKIYQEGDNNTASIEQKEGNNQAFIIQYGSDLEAIIHQYGNGNYASILQDFRNYSMTNLTDGFRSAEITQLNHNNTATVEQSVPTEFPIIIHQKGNMEVHVQHH